MNNKRYLVSRNNREGLYAGRFRSMPQADVNWFDLPRKHRRASKYYDPLRKGEIK
jgi:hypothetical protein